MSSSSSLNVSTGSDDCTSDGSTGDTVADPGGFQGFHGNPLFKFIYSNRAVRLRFSNRAVELRCSNYSSNNGRKTGERGV